MNSPIIVGAGAVGCYIGANLAAGGAKPLFLGRERLGKAARSTGISSMTFSGRRLSIPAADVRWTERFEQLGDCDFAIVSVKSQDTEECAKKLAAALAPGTPIVSFQNGIRNADSLRRLMPGFPVFAGIVPFNVLQAGDGADFRQTTTGKLRIDHECLPILPQLFTWAETASLPLIPTREIQALQWGKLIRNLNNALNALSGLPLKQQLRDRAHRLLLAKALDEALRVLRAADVRAKNENAVPVGILPAILRLPTLIFERVASTQLRIDPGARLSMWTDLELRRPTEIDFINGEIVRLAREVGTSAPMHQRIVDLVKEAEMRRQGSPNLTADQLVKKLT